MIKHSFSIALALTSFLLTIGATSIQAQAAALDAYLADASLLPDEGIAFALLYDHNNLLLTLTANAGIHNGVIAILRSKEVPASGLSESVIGLFYQVLDLVLLLFISVALSLLTLAARLFFLMQAAPALHKPTDQQGEMK